MTPKTVLKRVAIIGSGPTGLMAATRLLNSQGAQAETPEVHLFEKRPALARKLLIAGSSGLNISHELSASEFSSHYEGMTPRFWQNLFSEFGPAEWIQFIEQDLKLETFLGTSRRYFVREMKASGLLSEWKRLLESRGVLIHRNAELTSFQRGDDGRFNLGFTPMKEMSADIVVFALGGGSWEEKLPAWPELFRHCGLEVVPFAAANAGYTVNWKKEFLAEAEGKPLKKIRFGNRRGEKDGELVVTQYGLEGTPVYFHGESGPAWLDLKPDLSESAILQKLQNVRENLSPIRRAKQKLELCEASLALLFHHLPETDRRDLGTLVKRVKKFPLILGEARPLAESISSRGGLALSEVNENLELKKFPGAYAGGEMLDWHAPTGGFLIQAAVSMGARIGNRVRAECD